MPLSQDNEHVLNTLWQLIISLWFGECHCTSALRNSFWKALWWNYRSGLATQCSSPTQCNSLFLKSNNHLFGKVLLLWRVSFLSWNTYSRCFKRMALCRLLFSRWFDCLFSQKVYLGVAQPNQTCTHYTSRCLWACVSSLHIIFLTIAQIMPPPFLV